MLASGTLNELAGGFDPNGEPDAEAYQQIALARLDRADADDLSRALRRRGVSPEVKRMGQHQAALAQRRSGDLDAAAEALGALAEDSNDRIALYAAIEAALIAIDRGLDDEAAAALVGRAEAIVAADPSVVDAYAAGAIEYANAALLVSKSEHAAVVDRLSGFASEHEGHALLGHASALLGESSLVLGRPADAVQAFRIAADRAQSGDRPAILLRLGKAHAEAQQWAESREAFAAYLEAEPEGAFVFEARFVFEGIIQISCLLKTKFTVNKLY